MYSRFAGPGLFIMGAMYTPPLPPDLPTSFTVTEAHEHGVPKWRLRRRDLLRPHHGTRAREALDALTRLQLLMRVLPVHAFVCGMTAAALHGMPLAWSDQDHAWAEPDIGVPAERTRIRRANVRGSRLSIDDADIVRHRGIRVLSIERTWVELSRVLSLQRFVAVTDHLIHWRHPLTTVAALEAAAERFAQSAGAPLRRTALAFADARSESPRESMVRAILVAAGLPRPACNVDIYDGNRFVARVDMIYRGTKLIIEYDGDYHNDPKQWSKDQVRRAELESLGYRVTVVTARDFDDPEQLIARIRRLLSTDA